MSTARFVRRLTSALTLGLVLSFSAPALAQMSFEGLDLNDGAKKKKSVKKKKRYSKKKRAAPEEKAEEAVPSGGVDLSGQPASGAPAISVGADQPTVKKEVAPVMSFEAVDVSGNTADRQKMENVLKLFKEEAYEASAMAAQEILQDEKLLGLHIEARYNLAKALYRMGLYHSSLGEFSTVLAAGPTTKHFKTGLEWLFFISRKTRNETVILDEIAKYSNFEFPEKFQSEFRYLLARYHFVRGRALDTVGQKGEADKSFDEVKRLSMMVPRGDAFYPRAKYLEGLAYFREGDKGGSTGEVAFRSALESMKEVVRLTRPGVKSAVQTKADKALRELAFMQLARTHYGHRQNRYAIFYFNKVERGNTQWLESLFESSWASYRIGQYERALGNLITLSSPFFREEYFPEALILKAVIYYENCRYRESTAIIDEFERIYLPVHDELERLTQKQMDSSEYYGVLAEVQRKNREDVERSNTDIILERILRLALTDQDLKKTNDSILELEEEMDGYASRSDTFKYSELSKRLIEDLKVQRSQLIDKAGIMAKGKLENELGELKKLLANGLRIKFETTTKEKEFLEEQLKQGGKTEIVKRYRYSVAVADDQLYWPYEGEYWRDELGTYQYTLTKGCIDRDTANRQVASDGL